MFIIHAYKGKDTQHKRYNVPVADGGGRADIDISAGLYPLGSTGVIPVSKRHNDGSCSF